MELMPQWIDTHLAPIHWQGLPVRMSAQRRRRRGMHPAQRRARRCCDLPPLRYRGEQLLGHPVLPRVLVRHDVLTTIVSIRSHSGDTYEDLTSLRSYKALVCFPPSAPLMLPLFVPLPSVLATYLGRSLVARLNLVASEFEFAELGGSGRCARSLVGARLSPVSLLRSSARPSLVPPALLAATRSRQREIVRTGESSRTCCSTSSIFPFLPDTSRAFSGGGTGAGGCSRSRRPPPPLPSRDDGPRGLSLMLPLVVLRRIPSRAGSSLWPWLCSSCCCCCCCFCCSRS